MFRVTKVGSYFCVITYGEPDLRLAIYLEALPKFKYELSCEKISLSFMSNLINALRAKSGNSLKSALGNKDVLMSSIMDACITKLADQADPDDEEAKRKLKKMRMMRIFMEAQRVQREEEALAREKEGNNDNNKMVNEGTGDSTVEKNTNTVDNNIEENPIETNEEERELQEDDPHGLNPRGRRQHCYLYIFKKTCH
jgi:hypothetical protein